MMPILSLLAIVVSQKVFAVLAGKPLMNRLHWFVLLLLFPHMACATWVDTQGSYVFPGSVSEAEACAKADDRARMRAISQITGETLSAEEIQRCNDQQGDEIQCAQNSAIWTSLGGTIVQTRNRIEQVIPEQESYRRCVVQFEADVQIPQGVPDPSFTIGVILNQAVYRNGEAMVIRLHPSVPMYVQIYQWLPYERGDAQVSRLFPNAFDRQIHLEVPGTVPSTEGRKHYDLQPTFPTITPSAQKMVDEYLLVVATRNPVVLRDRYGLDDFQKEMAELPRNDSRMVRRSYAIVRGAE